MKINNLTINFVQKKYLLHKCKGSKFFCNQNRLFSLFNTITKSTSSELEGLEKFIKVFEDESPLIEVKNGLTFSTLNMSKLIHTIAHPSVLLYSYELIKSKKGKMIATKYNKLCKYIIEISKQLRAGIFKFKLSSMILRKLSKVRLSSKSLSERIVLKALELLFTHVFEPMFSNCSHGFRPKRSHLSALKEIEHKFKGKKWIIEVDLENCFNSISVSDKLMSVLRISIKCSKTLALIKSALKAGYNLKHNVIKGEFVDTPKNNILSPLLCNIFLHQFDVFMEKIILKYQTKAKRGADSKEYREKLRVKKKAEIILKENFSQKFYNKYELSKEEFDLRKNYVKNIKNSISGLWTLKSTDPMDKNYIKVNYIRYADDFIIGIASSYQTALNILKECKDFLFNELALVISEEKINITDASKGIKFLGTVITNRKMKHKSVVILKKDVKKGHRVTVTSRLSFCAPIESLFKRLVNRGLFKWNCIKGQKDRIRPTALKFMIHFDHSIILEYYNSIIYGLLHYYKFVDNRISLSSIVNCLKHSCALTLALKLKLRTSAKVYKKFGKLLFDPKSKTGIFLPFDFKRLSYLERFKESNNFITPENVINSKIPYSKAQKVITRK
jgi:retron-type reverse transcriptase